MFPGLVNDQTIATNHPKQLQPRTMFSIHIAVAFLCFRELAIIPGRKYMGMMNAKTMISHTDISLSSNYKENATLLLWAELL